VRQGRAAAAEREMPAAGGVEACLIVALVSEKETQA
jgi:hypothetical protein